MNYVDWLRVGSTVLSLLALGFALAAVYNTVKARRIQRQLEEDLHSRKKELEL
jgi:hypothetical protein